MKRFPTILFWMAIAGAVNAGEVAQSTFTTAVVDRQPIDAVETLDLDHTVVYYFTDLRNLDGHTVTHRWEHGGQLMAEVPFAVAGPRWRVWSSKQLMPAWTGEWRVTVVDENGAVLTSDSFQYTSGE